MAAFVYAVAMAAGLLREGAVIGTKLTEDKGASVIFSAKALALNMPPASGNNGAPAIKLSMRRRVLSID